MYAVWKGNCLPMSLIIMCGWKFLCAKCVLHTGNTFDLISCNHLKEQL